MADTTADVPESARKRRRTAQACLNCRTRKTKCDGQRPSCSNCGALSVECHYDASDASTNIIVPKNYVASLEERLRNVERSLEQHDNLLKGHLSSCDPRSNEVPRSQDTVSADAPFETQTDGLGIAFMDDSSDAFFGESATITFTRQLTQASSTFFGSERVQELSVTNGTPSGCHRSQPTRTTPKTSLWSPYPLSSPDAERLLNAYFDTMGLLFPFIHEGTFWQRYTATCTQDSLKAPRAFFGVLNMMLAVAVNSDRDGNLDVNERLAQSHCYYENAVAVVGNTIESSVSLESVQYLLLLTLYRQGTQGALRTWIVHGQLVQAALSIGLHSGHAPSSADNVDIASRRRTWLTIYCLDQVLSATLGRPSSIPGDLVDHLRVSPWPSATIDHPETDLSTVFLDLSVDLYRVMGRALTRQYGNNAGTEEAFEDELSKIQVAAELRHSLHRWVNSLPPLWALLQVEELMLPVPENRTTRLRTILTLRYYSVYILVHRPLITVALRKLLQSPSISAKTSSQTLQLVISEANNCLSAARCTVEIAHAMVGSLAGGKGRLGVWFFNLYYVFSAALILYAVELVHLSSNNGDSSRPSSPTADTYLHQAEETISLLDIGNSLTESCAGYIHHLRDLSSGRKRLRSYSTQIDDDMESNIRVGMRNDPSQLNVDTTSFDDFYGSGPALSEFLDLNWFDRTFTDNVA